MKNFLKTLAFILIILYSAGALFSENVYKRFFFLIIPAILVWHFYQRKNSPGIIYESGFEGLKSMGALGRIGSIVGLIISLISIFLAGVPGFSIFIVIGFAGSAGAGLMMVAIIFFFLLTVLSGVVTWLMTKLLQGKYVNKPILFSLFFLMVVLQIIRFAFIPIEEKPSNTFIPGGRLTPEEERQTQNVLKSSGDAPLAPIPTSNTTTTSSPLKVIFPNGGEVLTIGKTYTITWDSTNTHPVNINYFCEDGNIANIARAASNNGSFNWMVSVNNSSYKHCKIHIQGDEYRFGDESDGYFTVE